MEDRRSKRDLEDPLNDGDNSSWDERFPVDEVRDSVSLERVRRLYDSGTPLYTKDSIRFVHDQMKPPLKMGQELITPDFDGSPVEIEVDDWLIGADPFLYFHSIQHLLQQKAPHFSKPTYCPISIASRSYGRRSLMNSNGIQDDKFHFPTPVDPSRRTVDETIAFIKTTSETWESSDQCQQFRSIISRARIEVPINKVVGFALGAPSRMYPAVLYPEDPDDNSRSAYQHACLLTLCELLRQAPPGVAPGFKCLAQDPVYSETDEKALQALGIQVIDSPEGFLELDDNSVVMTVAPDLPVKQIVLELAKPAIIIWNDPRDHELGPDPQGISWADQDSPRTMEIYRKHYDVFDFPHLEAFQSISIFIRRKEIE